MHAYTACLHMHSQWRIQGGKGGASVPPFGLHLTLRSTDDELNGTPFLAIELRKLLLWLTLECFRRKFVRKWINWTGRAGSLSQNRSKMGVVLSQSGRGFSNFAHSLRARVYYNPSFTNHGSATDSHIHISTHTHTCTYPHQCTDLVFVRNT